MDFMATDALGRKWQLATVQLDYAQPERFGLEYTDENGEKQRPIMVHCALLGSIEGVYERIYRTYCWLVPSMGGARASTNTDYK